MIRKSVKWGKVAVFGIFFISSYKSNLKNHQVTVVRSIEVSRNNVTLISKYSKSLNAPTELLLEYIETCRLLDFQRFFFISKNRQK